ncbi:MAG: hypothetical protein COU33_01625 [Candidatus Magasanikbacteria bacterium CG10_big_fil_rev_8_21_14_0_10_43_6]|uniref:Uncharacterized protein n=1 Tax=Candidatus Magasanikbacteria bacterium CG10_big_fil_rev_8_21_14_0_10_43_6 TaxID=1974650 RepID=A0A2M6W1Q3_9BACT|nr:MAG: hypothetical protein COU33_01625 [Candidatus Magasanikbacteria bacterium CG10_big_fil_rev_8_21_14_0_10_43_6]
MRRDLLVVDHLEDLIHFLEDVLDVLLLAAQPEEDFPPHQHVVVLVEGVVGVEGSQRSLRLLNLLVHPEGDLEDRYPR